MSDRKPSVHKLDRLTVSIAFDKSINLVPVREPFLVPFLIYDRSTAVFSLLRQFPKEIIITSSITSGGATERVRM